MRFIGEALPGMHRVLDSTPIMRKGYRVSHVRQMIYADQMVTHCSPEVFDHRIVWP